MCLYKAHLALHVWMQAVTIDLHPVMTMVIATHLVQVHPTTNHLSKAAVEVVAPHPMFHSGDATLDRITTRANGTPTSYVTLAAARATRPQTAICSP